MQIIQLNWMHPVQFSLAAALLLVAFSETIHFHPGLFCSALSTATKSITGHSDLPTSLLAPESPINVNVNPYKSTAAVLNINARTVSPPLIALTREILGDDNVHVTSTPEEARSAARSVIHGNYSLVVPMGGDGTLSAWIDNLVSEIITHHGRAIGVDEAMEKLPVIGYVPRGTGNGLGHVVGCWQVDSDDAQNHQGHTQSFLSRINLFSRRKQKRHEKTKRLLLRLKEVGDLLQRLDNAPKDPSISAQTQADLEHELSEKCTIVEMPMMQVIHQDDDTNAYASSTSLYNATVTPRPNNKGDLCFFAGSGFDSLMLHDFQQIKAWSSTSTTLPTFLKDALSSVAGYCVALVTLTLPQTLRYGTHKIHVRVTTEDAEALWVDHRRGDFSELAVRSKSRLNSSDKVVTNEKVNGDVNIPKTNLSKPQKKQHLLYSGTTGIIAASTTPYYGGGLRLFPYARLIPNKLQLRLGRISPLEGFFNIPKIFEGSYRERSDRFGCLDFIGDEFDVEVSSPVYEEYLARKSRKRGDGWWSRIRGGRRQEEKEDRMTNGDSAVADTKGFPFQHSGESMGIKERFRLRVVKQPVRFVSFLRPRVIVDE